MLSEIPALDWRLGVNFYGFFQPLTLLNHGKDLFFPNGKVGPCDIWILMESLKDENQVFLCVKDQSLTPTPFFLFLSMGCLGVDHFSNGPLKIKGKVSKLFSLYIKKKSLGKNSLHSSQVNLQLGC